MGKLDGRVVLITGATGGMGAVTARLFAQEGARVVLGDLAGDAGSALARELGSQALFCRLDVTQAQDWARAVEAAHERFGALDVLVNNAGILKYASILDTTPEEAGQMMSVNFMGVVLGTQAVAPRMMAQGRGAIVNVASTAAMQVTNGTAIYSASKWAVRGFTKAAALEFGPYGVRVNSVHPGGVNTALSNPDAKAQQDIDAIFFDLPTPRAGRPEEIARATLYLSCDDSSYCNGTELVVDGGMLAGKYYPFLPGTPENLRPTGD